MDGRKKGGSGKGVRMLVTILMLLVLAGWFFLRTRMASSLSGGITFGAVVMLAILLIVKKKLDEKYAEADLAESERELAELEDELDEDDGTDGTQYLELNAEHPAFLIAMGFPSDTIYQVIRGERQYHFVKIGWGDINVSWPEKLIDPCGSDAEIAARMKKGYSIHKTDIQHVSLKFRRCVSTQQPNLGSLKLDTTDGKKSFILLDVLEMTPQDVQDFFADLRSVTDVDERALEREAQEDAAAQEDVEQLRADYDPEKARRRKPLGTILIVLAVVIESAWLFLDVPYLLFSILSIVLFLVPFVLVLVQPAYFTLLDLGGRKKAEKYRENGIVTVDVFIPVIIAALGLEFRSLMDFNILNWLVLLIALGVFSLVLTLVLYFCYRDIKGKPGQAAMLFVILMLFSFGFVVQVNYLLDFKEPDVGYTEVLDKHISTSSKLPDSYLLTVSVDGQEQELQAPPELYDGTEIGDEVIITTYHGAFGIRYADVWGVDEWEAYQTERD